MELRLEPILENEDKTKPIYDSEDCQNLLAMWEDYYPKIGFHLPWIGYFVMQQDEIVGSCAFTGKPQNNSVEVSYWTFKQNEGKGISTWACKALIDIAKASNPNLTIIAKTAPEENASTSILKRNGFTYSGIVQDHEIGNAWQWVLE
ncbi:MAG: GNAT family N-acetyltransferase [Flavobacteriaceae bacterium]